MGGGGPTAVDEAGSDMSNGSVSRSGAGAAFCC